VARKMAQVSLELLLLFLWAGCAETLTRHYLGTHSGDASHASVATASTAATENYDSIGRQLSNASPWEAKLSAAGDKVGGILDVVASHERAFLDPLKQFGQDCQQVQANAEERLRLGAIAVKDLAARRFRAAHVQGGLLAELDHLRHEEDLSKKSFDSAVQRRGSEFQAYVNWNDTNQQQLNVMSDVLVKLETKKATITGVNVNGSAMHGADPGSMTAGLDGIIGIFKSMEDSTTADGVKEAERAATSDGELVSLISSYKEGIMHFDGQFALKDKERVVAEATVSEVTEERDLRKMLQGIDITIVESLGRVCAWDRSGRVHAVHDAGEKIMADFAKQATMFLNQLNGLGFGQLTTTGLVQKSIFGTTARKSRLLAKSELAGATWNATLAQAVPSVVVSDSMLLRRKGWNATLAQAASSVATLNSSMLRRNRILAKPRHSQTWQRGVPNNNGIVTQPRDTFTLPSSAAVHVARGPLGQRSQGSTKSELALTNLRRLGLFHGGAAPPNAAEATLSDDAAVCVAEKRRLMTDIVETRRAAREARSSIGIAQAAVASQGSRIQLAQQRKASFQLALTNLGAAWGPVVTIVAADGWGLRDTLEDAVAEMAAVQADVDGFAAEENGRNAEGHSPKAAALRLALEAAGKSLAEMQDLASGNHAQSFPVFQTAFGEACISFGSSVQRVTSTENGLKELQGQNNEKLVQLTAELQQAKTQEQDLMLERNETEARCEASVFASTVSFLANRNAASSLSIRSTSEQRSNGSRSRSISSSSGDLTAAQTVLSEGDRASAWASAERFLGSML